MNRKVVNIIFRHSQIFIYIFVLLLLFLNGTRIDTLWALTISIIDTLFFIASYQLFNCLLTKTPRFMHNDFVKFLCIIMLIAVLSHSLYWVEYLVIQYVPFNIAPPKSEFLPFINFSRYMKVLLLIIVSMCLAIYKYAALTAIQTEELKQLSKLMKLQLLQSQINPHFIFNALNNIYALVYTRNDKAPDAILKLSDMLRYVTDHGQQEKVLITKDVEYIQNYIDFQILRFGESDRLQYQCHLDSESYSIAPILIQPFVENCFNHNDLATNADGYIRINIDVENACLHYHSENTFSMAHRGPEQEKKEGVGIANVEQRLKLYYQDAYELQISEEDNIYTIDLKIRLND